MTQPSSFHRLPCFGLRQVANAGESGSWSGTAGADQKRRRPAWWLGPTLFGLLVQLLLPGLGLWSQGQHRPQDARAVAVGERTFSVFSVNSATGQTELNGQPFQVVGLRTSNALISDTATQELIDNMDVFASYGINTFSVYFQGSKFGAVKGYNEDATLNPAYAERMKRIIEEADKRGMVILVGCLYYNSQTLAIWPSWGQEEANRAVANTVKWLRDNDFRNVFLDVDNEGQAVALMGWKADQFIAAGKAVDSTYAIGIGGPRGSAPPPNADLALHHATRVPGKPYVESEGEPRGSGYVYWVDWSTSCRTGNFCNVGVYTDDMKEDWLRLTTEHIQRGDGYMGASTWLQAVPPLGPNHRPGGDGTADDPGIRFWLEHVMNQVRGEEPTATPIPTPVRTSTPSPTATAGPPAEVPTATPTPVAPAVVGFVLVDADADRDLGPLVDGAVLDLAALPTRNLNVRAETAPATVGSVRFGLDGTADYRTESAPPYSLAGDAAGDYWAWTPAVGAHTVVAIPYTRANGTGTGGLPLAVTFTVVDGAVGEVPTAVLPPPDSAEPLLFADGFEAGDLGAWEYARGLIVQGELVSSGGYAARATGDGAPAYAVATLSEPMTELHVRLDFRLVDHPDAVDLLALRDVNDRILYRVSVDSDGAIGVGNGVTGESVTSGILVGSGSWHALEVHVSVAGATSVAEVWLDGTAVPSWTQQVDLGTAAIGKVQIGHAGTGRRFDVAFDEIAASSTCLGACPAGQSAAVPTATATEPVTAATASATPPAGPMEPTPDEATATATVEPPTPTPEPPTAEPGG